ncbi:MAG: hypothetical protein ACKVS6_15760 [Planctomycetota bacterium]
MNLSLSKATIGLASIFAAGSLATSVIFGSALGDPKDTIPFFVPPSPCNEVFFATPGNQLCFDIVAFDPDEELVILDWNDVPFGATTNPPVVTSGNPSVQVQFCYTPTPQDVGMQFQVEFTAANLDTQDHTKCDITIIVESPLSAEIESFTGKVVSHGGAVKLDWTTSSEIDNAYFNVYRSQSSFENAMQINKSPIVALGSPITGANYSQADRRVTKGSVYKYWLESVDIYGATQLFGPITVAAR